MQDNYINNFGFLQVNSFLQVNNFVVNNFYTADVDVGNGFKNGQEKTAEREACQEASRVDDLNVIDWDLAEEYEENINDEKEKFLPSKLKTLQLEQIYLYCENYVKAQRLNQCGTYLEFLIAKGATIDKKKLKRINSCKLRLCPYCAWRRSLRTFVNVKLCYDYIVKQDSKNNNLKSTFKLLTLTTENVTGEDLKGEVDAILKAFNRFRQYKAFKDAFCGFVRALEVTCDREPIITKKMYFGKKHDYFKKRGLHIGDSNPNYLYFNVHIHVLLHTYRKRYQENYLKTSFIVKLWRQALGADYDPVCDIRNFKAKNKDTRGREIAEIAKYTVKPVDYMRGNCDNREHINHEFMIDVDVIGFLDSALSGRRLLAYGGTFRDAHNALGLDDEKMVDDKDRTTAEEYILKYYFSFKNKLYRRIRD